MVGAGAKMCAMNLATNNILIKILLKNLTKFSEIVGLDHPAGPPGTTGFNVWFEYYHKIVSYYSIINSTKTRYIKTNTQKK